MGRTTLLLFDFILFILLSVFILLINLIGGCLAEATPKGRMCKEVLGEVGRMASTVEAIRASTVVV